MHDIFHPVSTGRPATKKTSYACCPCSSNAFAPGEPDGEPRTTMNYLHSLLAPCAGATIGG